MPTFFGGEGVTLVNRTKFPVSFRFDGTEYYLRPGKTESFPRVLIRFAMEQNRIMGTEDPLDMRRFDSLVGVEGMHKTTPLTEAQLRKIAPDRWDRSKMTERAANAVTIPGDSPSAFEARFASEDSDPMFGVDNAAATTGNESAMGNDENPTVLAAARREGAFNPAAATSESGALDMQRDSAALRQNDVR